MERAAGALVRFRNIAAVLQALPDPDPGSKIHFAAGE